jgi:hypothetical protein
MSMKKNWIFLAPLAVLGLAAVAALLIFVGGEVVKYLWNWLMPPIFGLRQITFWQAFGLLALSRILFGGHSYRSGGGRHRSPEDRERFRQKMRQRFGFHSTAGEQTETPC